MTLAPLAAPADLPTVWQTHGDVHKAIAVASSSVRDAAGVPISSTTATIRVPGGSHALLRLPAPVTEVATVVLDGTTLAASEYEVLAEGLWRFGGWGCGPVPVDVTLTFGLAEVPADIVDLAAQLATSWLQHREAGGGSVGGLRSVKVDDAAETYNDEAAGQVSPAFIPRVTRSWLAARFNGAGAVVVGSL